LTDPTRRGGGLRKIAGGDGSPRRSSSKGACFQGKYVAEIAGKLARAG
jgi:hypothetical protein